MALGFLTLAPPWRYPLKILPKAAPSCVQAGAHKVHTQEGILREFPRLLLQEELLLSDAYL